MLALLRPEKTVRPRPADQEGSRYVRSYLIMRLFVGALGVALPLMLVFVDGLAFDGDPFPRDSLSAYYYSGVRELFVGTLCATAVFLVTYKVAELSLDNTLSTLAGAAALVVALFPTGRDAGDDIALTPLQDRLGEGVVQTIHFVAAATFIVSLGVITYFFGVREGARPPREGNRSPAFWRSYHWACAGTIAAALEWILVTMLAGWPRTSLLIGEALSVWAFGASWLAKGAEMDVLRGTAAGEAAASRPA
jgi:thiol:disulfide interchange protein